VSFSFACAEDEGGDELADDEEDEDEEEFLDVADEEEGLEEEEEDEEDESLCLRRRREDEEDDDDGVAVLPTFSPDAACMVDPPRFPPSRPSLSALAVACALAGTECFLFTFFSRPLM
jgi:hypothetical protein